MIQFRKCEVVYVVCLFVSCVEEILKADPSQLQAQDSVYGGTPLHWAKTAEVETSAHTLTVNVTYY